MAMRFMNPLAVVSGRTLASRTGGCNLSPAFIDLRHGGTTQAIAGSRRAGRHARHAAPAAWVLRIRAGPQRFARRPARAADVLHTPAPQARSGRRSDPRARQPLDPALRQGPLHDLPLGARRPTGGAAAWLGFTCGTVRGFRRTAACRGILGDRHRRTGAWHLARPLLGPAAFS